jgi:DNA primase
MREYYIDQAKIEEIRESADIVETIGEYIPIKKAGKSYTALCPFHSEKKPSFTISPQKQLYHCFGCGASGNVISFVMKYESISFIEALEVLAKRYGIKLEKRAMGPEDKEKKKLLEANEFAFSFFRKQLEERSGKRALEYLKKRNITGAMIEEFGLGFAPEGWNNLLNAAQAEGIPHSVLESAGLSIKSDKGRYYDRFRNRIMFTFYNSIGRKIGFAGRSLGDDDPKYLNIPETALYKKRYTLYGLYQGKEEIRKRDRCLVVEGYTDLLALHQNGFKHAVAISGTALTDEQTRILRKYTRNVYVAFDADKPGKQATMRGISIFIENGLVPYIMILPKDMDPDEIIQRAGPEAFQKHVEGAEHFVDFKFRVLLKRYSVNDPVQKAEIIREMSRTVAEVKDLTERQTWVSVLAKKLGVDESIFLGVKEKKGKQELFVPSILPLENICIELAMMVAMNPERFEEVYDLFVQEHLMRDIPKVIMQYVEKKVSAHKQISIADVVALLNNEEEQRRIASMLFNIKDGIAEIDISKMFDQYIRRIKTHRLKERWTIIREEIRKKKGDVKAINELLEEQRKIAVSLKGIGGNIGKQT